VEGGFEEKWADKITSIQFELRNDTRRNSGNKLTTCNTANNMTESEAIK
jgi:hypothetical protein